MTIFIIACVHNVDSFFWQIGRISECLGSIMSDMRVPELPGVHTVHDCLASRYPAFPAAPAELSLGPAQPTQFVHHRAPERQTKLDLL